MGRPIARRSRAWRTVIAFAGPLGLVLAIVLLSERHYLSAVVLAVLASEAMLRS